MSLPSYSNLVLDLDQQPLFLISDLHAGAHNQEIEFHTKKKLELLINHIHQQNGQVIILGDLFDYWHESNYKTPACLSDWTHFLKVLHDSTRPSILLTGNHDHWAGIALSDLGFVIVEESIVLKSDQSQWFLIHGDGLPDEQGRLVRTGFNKVFRDPTINTWFNHLPFRLRIHLMKSFSQFRRYRIESDNNHIDDALHLENWLKESNFKGLVYGHTHQSSYKEIDHQFLINLGTFYADSLVMTIQSNAHIVTTLDDLLTKQSKH